MASTPECWPFVCCATAITLQVLLDRSRESRFQVFVVFAVVIMSACHQHFVSLVFAFFLNGVSPEGLYLEPNPGQAGISWPGREIQVRVLKSSLDLPGSSFSRICASVPCFCRQTPFCTIFVFCMIGNHSILDVWVARTLCIKKSCVMKLPSG